MYIASQTASDQGFRLPSAESGTGCAFDDAWCVLGDHVVVVERDPLARPVADMHQTFVEQSHQVLIEQS